MRRTRLLSCFWRQLLRSRESVCVENSMFFVAHFCVALVYINCRIVDVLYGKCSALFE
jgi:hypothetical protein